MKTPIAVALLASSLVFANLADADCPTSTLTCMGDQTTSTKPQAATACQDRWSVEYDLIAGTVRSGSVGFQGASSGSVQAVDEYTVLGLPTGTPVPLLAGLQVSGSIRFCNRPTIPATGQLHARLTEGTSNTQQVLTHARLPPCEDPGLCCGTSASVDRTLSVAIDTAAGLPFRLTLEVSASVGFSMMGSIEGQLLFEGLPPGAWVQSCQGYYKDNPVPALRTSWGHLKARYL